ncbi:ATP-binding cassette domain-containing protein [Flavimarina sp. Hel_I_48]|uniref:ATP-binding cassette domain-containing protein n=1 Tax=Flavimarina sp. Hel_I_48 TaxID=1392488 RepID=UPI0004DF58D7|nr:ATP-binding cassette domain-containing protein [Flavimarina sp. Hel_I_48]
MAHLQLGNASKSFGKKHILKKVSFQLKTGEILGLFGSNGSGKSTLLKILFGTLKSDILDLKIDGKTFRGSDIIKHQKIGYLPQFSFLPAANRVWDVVPKFFEDGKLQDRVMRDPGVERISGTKIGQLSQGERRYLELQLVGNLAHPFLMLDEPFSMVEPLYIEHINRFLLQIKETKGILLTDHYYHNVWEISDRKKLLKEGVLNNIQTKENLREMGYIRSIE